MFLAARAGHDNQPTARLGRARGDLDLATRFEGFARHIHAIREMSTLAAARHHAYGSLISSGPIEPSPMVIWTTTCPRCQHPSQFQA